MGTNSPCVNCGANARVCKECDWYNGIWIPKDQYEARLKADMAAMLTEIQLEIQGIEEDMCIRDSKAEMGFYRWIKKSDVENIIQQKINELRGNEDVEI